jgi:hypothetical protein
MEEKKAFIEDLLDRPIALLILSNVIFFGSYLVWGLYKVITTPPIPEALKGIILGGN